MSALALRAFSIGVCGFIFVKVLAPGFFARQDTQTPMTIAIVSVLVNIALSLILVRTMQHTGLALAISIAAWVNASLLLLVLMRRGVYKPESGWFWFLLKIATAVGLMTAVLIYLNQPSEIWLAWGLFQRIWQLCILVFSGVFTYAICLLVLGIRPYQMLLRPN